MRRWSLRPAAARALRRAALAAVFLGGASTARAQPIDSLRTVLERSIVRGDMAALDSVIARLRDEARETPENVTVQYDLGYALHRRAGAITEAGRDGKAQPLLEEAERALARAVSLGGGGSALALRGTVTGQLAQVSGAFRAMRLGPRAFKQLDEAKELAPDDPRIALLNGMVRLRAPRAFGGGTERAEREFRRAVLLFESDGARSPAPTWGRVDAHIWLGIALAKLGRRDEARAEYAKALAMAPGHAWVTTTLLPKVAERAGERDSVDRR
jgi:Flp pilus assembly protein TadD